MESKQAGSVSDRMGFATHRDVQQVPLGHEHDQSPPHSWEARGRTGQPFARTGLSDAKSHQGRVTTSRSRDNARNGQGIGAGRKRHVSAGRNSRPELLRRPAQASGHLAEVPELDLGVPTVD